MNLPVYTPLSSSPREIRLVTIRPSSDSLSPIECSTSIVSLDEDPVPKYFALSYAWGAPGITKTIILNQVEIQVTENLRAALCYLRSAQAEVQNRDQQFCFWIDAICINQADLDERSQQVQLMRDIYSLAARVIVWLGDEGDDARLALETIQDLYFKFGRMKNEESKAEALQALNDLEGSPKAVAIVSFFERSWWTRLWTVQEYVFGKEIKFLCGSISCSWSMLHWWGLVITATMDAAEWKYEKNSFLSMIATKGCEGLFSKTYIRQQYLLHKRRTMKMFSLLAVLNGVECTNPRDRIFAMQGLASDGDAFGVPDYTVSVSDLYCDVAGTMAEITEDLGVLCCKQQGLSTAPDGVILPSWVPSWGQSGHVRPLDVRLFNAGSERKSLARYLPEPSRALHVQGVIWDTVTAVDTLQTKRSIPHGEWTREIAARKRQADLFDIWKRETACFKDDPSQKPRAIHCYNCYGPVLDQLYYCSICEDGLFYICFGCVEDGVWCGDHDHELSRREIIDKNAHTRELGRFRLDSSKKEYKILPEDTPMWAKLIYEGRSKNYPTGIPQLQAYFRTILFDTDYIGHTRLLSSEDRFYDFAKVFGLAFLFQAWYPPCSELGRWKRNTFFFLAEPVKFEIFLGEPGFEGTLTLPSNVSAATIIAESCGIVNLRQFVLSVEHKTKARQFFVTERGYMGLGPPHVEVGDAVCVFPGLQVPMMLRKKDDYFQLQAECYVHGIMDGEVIKGLDKGEVSLEEIKIK